MAETMIERVAEALIAVPDQSGLTVRECAVVLARAAIAAMRDPTETMIDATDNSGQVRTSFRDEWRLAIDAALAELKEVGS